VDGSDARAGIHGEVVTPALRSRTAVKNLRALLWISVVFAALTVLLTPIVYFYTSTKLPSLESEFDLERILRASIESERRSLLLGMFDKQKDPIDFKRPDYVRLPKYLVAAYITERGCPTYFQSPREDGFPWAKRQVLGLFRIEPGGDGWCEQLFAANLAMRVGAKGSLEITVGSHKIHRFLKKDTLIAYDLHSVRLAPGIIGVEDGSKALFKKPLSELTLAEIAEYALALPPHGYWDQMTKCQNPTLIRQARDSVIRDLQMVSLIPESEARTATAQPVACLREN
jgi:membrane carboxypeptidase/penicillin-binding protein